LNTRIYRGFLLGVAATFFMTLVHLLIITASGRMSAAAVTSEMLPEVIIVKILGPSLAVSIRVLLGMLIHFGYGGFWGGVLFALAPRVTVWKGLAMGAFLYLIMQVFLFPFLGRGIFGTAIVHRSLVQVFLPVATHLTYGTVLGYLGSRRDTAVQAL
jgi:hypothetical protein